MPDKQTRSVLALLVFLALWIDGSFYPLILLPFLFIRFFCRESLSTIGLDKKNVRLSLVLGILSGLLVLVAYFPFHLYYLYRRLWEPLHTGVIFTDLVWYPLYEEIAYRGFFLGFFARRDSSISGTNLALNLIQALLFVSVHHHHVSAGLTLLLIPVFLLGFLNGVVFLRTRNIAGCVLSHVLTNGLALLLQTFTC